MSLLHIRVAKLFAWRLLWWAFGLLVLVTAIYCAGWASADLFLAGLWISTVTGVTSAALALGAVLLPRVRLWISSGGNPPAAEEEGGRSVDAADGETSALPSVPPTNLLNPPTPSLQAGFVSLCREGVPPAAVRDDAVAAGGATKFPATNAGERPPE